MGSLCNSYVTLKERYYIIYFVNIIVYHSIMFSHLFKLSQQIIHFVSLNDKSSSHRGTVLRLDSTDYY